MTERWSSDRRLRHRGDLYTFLQHRPIRSGLQTDELLTILAQHVGPAKRALADEVGFRLADRPSQAEVIRNLRAVGLLANDDVPLLRP